MQTKKLFPKILLFFYLIPYLGVLLLTALDCFIVYAYKEWFWVKEWVLNIPMEVLASYLLMAMIYGLFGVTAYMIFFGKTWQKWVTPIISMASAFLFPILRYIVHHFGYGKYLSDIEMLDWYNEDVTMGTTFFIYSFLALFVTLAERLYYAVILREKPIDRGRVISPRHPIGLSMLLLFGSLLIWTTIYFFQIGDFTAESILTLIVEYAINIAGFFSSVLAGHVVSKWHRRAKETV